MASGDIYVALDIAIDETQISDDAIDRLRTRWDNWEPDDGDLEVAILEEGAGYAAALGYAVSQMFMAAFAQFGLTLYGIPMGAGSPAETTVTIEVVDDNGPYTIPAGAQFNIDGFAFNIASDTTIPNGETEATGVQVFCAVNTAAANGLTGDLIAQLSLPSFVTNITVEAPTDEGTDPQTMAQYRDSLSSELQLRAKTIVTTRDFEFEALNFSPAIGRVVAVGDTARLVNVFLATPTGGVVDSTTKANLTAHYEEFALVNTDFSINDAEYSMVSVDYEVIKVPGSTTDPTALQALINSVLSQRLSPPYFGQAGSGQPPVTSAVGWIADPTIYKNDIVSLIGNVPGVQHVISVTLSANENADGSGAAIDPDSDGNITLPGTAPLATAGTMTGTVDV